MKKIILLVSMLLSMSAQLAQAQIAPSKKAPAAQVEQEENDDGPSQGPMVRPSPQQMHDMAKAQYVKMCPMMVDVPAEKGGDADIKGHPKFQAYCECFAEKFTVRMLKFSAEMERTGSMPAVSKAQADQTKFEERGMRDSCRKSVNMPALKLPLK